jgi:hypothetical protein
MVALTPPYPPDQHDPRAALPFYMVGPPNTASGSRVTYRSIPVNSTNIVIGPVGAIGDYLAGLLMTPLTTAPGQIIIGDGVAPNMTLFVGGIGSVLSLDARPLPLGISSRTGGWFITTGSNMALLAVGSFT